jgi:predicted permease
MSEWLQDLRYGIRMVAKRPGTSAIAIVALALGIGLTTTMFSIVNGVLLRGLPFDESDRLLVLRRASVKEPARREAPPLHDFVDWRARQTTLEPLAGYNRQQFVVAGETDFPERLRGIRCTTNLMQVLRVAPMLGRDFTEADGLPGAPAVALISHRQWQSRFGGRADAVGAVVRLNGVPTQVVGVMPEKFGFPEAEEIWMPRPLDLPAKRGEGDRLTTIGRLRDGVDVARASAEFDAIARQLAQEHPENKDTIASAVPFIEQAIPQQISTTFYTMLGAVLGVMLIACVNVTNLQLARASERVKEFAVRAALGSGRWRIVRQSLAEGLVLSIVGAALGLAIAQLGAIYFMRAIADTQPPFWIDVRLDTMVLLFVTAIAVAATLVSSTVPGLRVARIDANAVLKDDTRGATSVRMGRFGRWLVIVEVTVSCVLLVVSGLMVRSILATSRLDYPFATKDVLYAQITLEQRAFPDAAAVARAVNDLQTQVASLPGVRHAAVATGVPIGGGRSSFSIEGERYAAPEDRPAANRIAAGPAYFDVLGVTLRSGRVFTEADVDGAPLVAVVDDAFVAKYLPTGGAIGRRIRFGDDKQPWITIVGIVPALLQPTQPNQPGEVVYVPYAQSRDRFGLVLARTAGDPLAVAPALRAMVAREFQDTPLANVNSLADQLWRNGWAFRLFGGLFMTFGAAALLLAAAGLYGVMAFTVRRRTQEIGVRMALGASQRGVLGLVLWQGLWRVGLGVLVGLVPAWYVGTLMQALLANVSPADPMVLMTSSATLLLAGALASLVPALRASAVDPLTALRRD